MPRRGASVTQADVARIIRAVMQTGLPIVRVVARPDGISVETQPAPESAPPLAPVEDDEEIVL